MSEAFSVWSLFESLHDPHGMNTDGIPSYYKTLLANISKYYKIHPTSEYQFGHRYSNLSKWDDDISWPVFEQQLFDDLDWCNDNLKYSFCLSLDTSRSATIDDDEYYENFEIYLSSYLTINFSDEDDHLAFKLART